MKRYRLCFLGFGNVGRALARLLGAKSQELRERYAIEYDIVGVATRRMGWRANGQAFSSADEVSSQNGLNEWLAVARPDVLFETTSLNPESGQPAIDYMRASLEAGIHNDAPTRFLKTVPFDEWPSRLKELLPNASFNFVENERSGIGAIVVLHARRRQLITHRDVQKSRSESDGRETASSSSARKDSKPEPRSLQSMAAGFVADDPAVRAIVRQVETAAARKMPILIRGETGTGKEQLARHAHMASGRTGAFVPVNCAALPESLIESELFGYAAGAFTGARRGGAIGLVKEADGGTLFLDEIGDMPVALQAVLLRLLDDWTVRPVGGVRSKVDVFLISATNARLDKAIAEANLIKFNTTEEAEKAGFKLAKNCH